MRKLTVIKIALLLVGILLIATILYKFYEVKNFQKDLRPITEAERQKIIQILGEKINVTNADIIYGNVLMSGHGTLVQVQVKEGNLRKSYLINLDNNNFVRKYDEQ